MFSYHLPGGEPNIVVKLDSAGKIKYGTPLKHQAYTTVIDILEDNRWSFHLRKIIDFGCEEMRLFQLMRRLDAVEHVLNVDVDEAMLLSNKSSVEPLVSDHLKYRDRPLRAEVLMGSITDSVEDVRNTDAVISLDVIQKLQSEELEKVVQNIFGFIQPKLVILSTPNHEFNVLLNEINESGFRLQSHKFEWTRKEFKIWTSQICTKFPNYSFAVLGIGPPTPDKAELGFATQMALFARNDIIDRPLANAINTNLQSDDRAEVQYKQIYVVDFPFQIDKRTKEEKIESEILNYLSYAHKAERYYNRERFIFQIPIKPIIEYASKIDATEEDVLLVLKAQNYVVENEFIVITQDYIDEHYTCKGDDLYEDLDEDFLDFEPYRCSPNDDYDDDLENLENRFSVCSITDEHNDDEENWD